MAKYRKIDEAISRRSLNWLENYLMDSIEQDYEKIMSGEVSLLSICKDAVEYSKYNHIYFNTREDREQIYQMARECLSRVEDYMAEQKGFADDDEDEFPSYANESRNPLKMHQSTLEGLEEIYRKNPRKMSTFEIESALEYLIAYGYANPNQTQETMEELKNELERRQGTNESRTIRLSEGQLKQMISESVGRVINEIGDKDPKMFRKLGALARRKLDNGDIEGSDEAIRYAREKHQYGPASHSTKKKMGKQWAKGFWRGDKIVTAGEKENINEIGDTNAGLAAIKKAQTQASDLGRKNQSKRFEDYGNKIDGGIIQAMNDRIIRFVNSNMRTVTINYTGQVTGDNYAGNHLKYAASIIQVTNPRVARIIAKWVAEHVENVSSEETDWHRYYAQ